MSCCGRDDKLKTCRWLCMKVQVLFLSMCSYVFCVFRLDFFGVGMRGVFTSPVESSDSERVWKPDVPWSRKLTPIQDEEANRKCPTWRSSWINVLNIKIGSKLGPLNFFHAIRTLCNQYLGILVQESLVVQPCMFDAAVSRWYAQLMRYLLRLTASTRELNNMFTESTKIDIETSNFSSRLVSISR